jgi:hypothetical protein
LPRGIRIYAISDIHGCADLLQKMFTVIDRDLVNAGSMRAIHVFLGDYIDRGPESRQTIDLLVNRSRDYETVFLKGNHEAFLFDVLKSPSQLQSWKQYGGLQTLASYGLTPSLNPDEAEQAELIKEELADRIPLHQRRFFNNLRLRFVCGDFFSCTLASGPESRCRSRRRKTCFGYGMNSSKARSGFLSTSFTDTLRCANPTFVPTELILTPALNPRKSARVNSALRYHRARFQSCKGKRPLT